MTNRNSDDNKFHVFYAIDYSVIRGSKRAQTRQFIRQLFSFIRIYCQSFECSSNDLLDGWIQFSDIFPGLPCIDQRKCP